MLQGTFSRLGRKKFAGLPIWLIGLLLLLMAYLYRKMTPKSAIQKILSPKLNAQNIRYWTAISDYETGDWTNTFSVKGHNLFSMHYTDHDPYAVGSTLGDGAALAVYASYEDSCRGLIDYFRRLSWSTLNFNSLNELIVYMKGKGYFGQNFDVYLAGVTRKYKQLYGNS